MSADTEALLATVREAIASQHGALTCHEPDSPSLNGARVRGYSALDSLAAEINELKRQLESVEKFLASPPGPDYYPAGIHWMRDRDG